MKWKARETHAQKISRKREWTTTYAWRPHRTKEGYRIWLQACWTRLEPGIGLFTSFHRVYAIMPDPLPKDEKSYLDKKLCILCNDESPVLVCDSCRATVQSFKSILVEEKRL